MFQRFHALKERNERGFTLIELLVVILIIAVLAAIAIPAFLKQREKSYVSQSESALKNAATAMESYATGNNGTYPAVGAAGKTLIDTEGFRDVTGVTLSIVSSGSGAYCLQADHSQLTSNYFYSSATGKPAAGNCPAP